VIVVFFFVVGVVVGIVFGIIGMSSVVCVDGLCRGSEARILVTRSARFMRGGGIVMCVWGFWVVVGCGGVVVIMAVIIVAVTKRSTASKRKVHVSQIQWVVLVVGML